MLGTFNPESKQISEHWNYVYHMVTSVGARLRDDRPLLVYLDPIKDLDISARNPTFGSV